MTVQDQATWPEAVDLGEVTAAWRAWQTGPDGVLVRLVGDEELVMDGAVVRGTRARTRWPKLKGEGRSA